MDYKVFIEWPKYFSLDQIAESGQAFRWIKKGTQDYIVVANNTLAHLKKDSDQLVLDGITRQQFDQFWLEYLGLDEDYEFIQNQLSNKDQYLDKALMARSGIRILKQNLWEMIVTFIVSGNNNIPRIKNSVKELSQRYGRFIGTVDQEKYYSFPTPYELSVASMDELRACGLGYRDKYIFNSIRLVLSGEVNLEYIMNSSTQEARQELKKLQGVGNKVADCILLFACRKYNVFPVDTWVKKILATYYDYNQTNITKIYKFAHEHFGNYCGIAQQYLFDYIRNDQ